MTTPRKTATLYLQDECPYKCSYCVLSGPNHQVRESLARTAEGSAKIVQFFRDRPGYHLFLTGGEIMYMPGFTDLCLGLSESSYLSIDTANSVEGPTFEQFLSEVSAERVDFIRCGLHEHDEGPRLVPYLSRIERMQSKGFAVFVTFVAAPHRLSALPVYYDLFRANGVPFVVVPLLSRDYPKAYTEDERDLIDRYMVSAVYRSRMGGFRQSKGKLCNAGASRINVNCVDGSIRPCWRNPTPIGNIYENRLSASPEPVPCAKEWCSIEYEPQLDLEDLFEQDLRHILKILPGYDTRLYEEIIRLTS